MNCIKCASNMEQVTVSTLRGLVEIDRCVDCGGIWFDHDEAIILREKWMSEFVDSGDPKVGRYYNKIRDLNCPVCDITMDKRSDEEQPHIRYEMCNEHGMFLDAGEYTDYANDTIGDIFKGALAQLEDRYTDRQTKAA